MNDNVQPSALAMKSKTDTFRPELALLADQMKALSHPARLMILEVLATRGTCICGEVVEEIPLAQASVSRHLATLKETKLIKGEVDGPRSCYCVDYEELGKLRSVFTTFFDALPASPQKPQCC